MAAPVPPPARLVSPGAAAALVAAGVLAAYANSLGGPFVFDDQVAIVGNPSLRSLGAALVPPADSGLTVAGRPLLNLSFALNRAAGGDQVWGYHAVNLAIHVAAALLLTALVRRTLERLAHPAAGPVALAAGLLWGVHPLTTAAVTYLSQRAESLAAALMLAGLYAFARAAAPGAGRGWMALAVAAAFAGVATKETAVVLPVLALLYDRGVLAGSFREALRLRGGRHAALASSWLLAAALVAQAGNRGGTAGFGSAAALPYLLQQGEAVLTYLRLAVWPAPLVFDYGTPLPAGVADALPGVLVAAALLAASVLLWFRSPRTGFLAAAAWVLLAPSSSVVPVATQTMAEHRAYLPLAAGVVAAVLILARFAPRAVLPAALAAAVGLGAATHHRNRAYQDEAALWADTAAKAPANPRAHQNLGFALSRRGEPEAAVAAFRRALELRPDDATAANNLGNALLALGRADEARTVLVAAVDRHPRDPDLRTTRGLLHLQAGEWAEAERQLRAAVDLAPGYALAQSNLGQALAARGDAAGAEAAFAAAVRLAPEDPGFRNNLANHLAALGRTAEAGGHFLAAERLAPGDALTLFNHACLLQRTGRTAEAIARFEAALAARPDYPEALVNLGAALEQAGRPAEAAARYEAALRLRPDDPLAGANLRRLRGGAR